jgi:uncharacterized protein YecE (DUF72 family)
VTLWIGTSGWQYRDWRAAFYPARLPTARWLEHYATRFATVEVNSTFYRLPVARSFVEWRDRTPDGFVFAVKASRYLTHVKRLADPEQPIRTFMERAGGLGSKLGPVLVQLPPNLRVDVGRLAATLDAFPRGVRIAVEPRHESWDCDEVVDLLHDRDAALCLADRRGPVGPLHATATWAFVRLHAGRARPEPCYGRRALATWVDRIVELYGPSVDGYVYCNNDTHACAVRNADELVGIAARAGLDVAAPGGVGRR